MSNQASFSINEIMPYASTTRQVSPLELQAEALNACTYVFEPVNRIKQFTKRDCRPCDIIVLDTGIPQMDGNQLLKNLGSHHSLIVRNFQADLNLNNRTSLSQWVDGAILKMEFDRLVKEWQRETRKYSLTFRRYAHPAYQAILALGKPAIPLILQELERRPDWWFEALKALSKSDPTSPGDNFTKAASAWIEWESEIIFAPEMISRDLASRYPQLVADGADETSPVDNNYNCIAWAAKGDKSIWWQPGNETGAYWPTGVLDDFSFDCFVQLFESLGYVRCTDASLESHHEKVALYGDALGFTHVAKQLPNGSWTSKLGPDEDIQHNSLSALEGNASYGKVKQILRKPLVTQPS